MTGDELSAVTLATGIELAVWDSGPRDAPALIFLHGFPESHRSWRHQIRHFSARYRCIAPDQRGYGGSSKPQDVASYSADRLIADIFQLADALGVESFTIVGHDWGGAISWPIAMIGQASGRVTRAVIANAPHAALFQRLLYTDPVQRRASQYMRAFRDPANDDLVRQHGLAALLVKALRWQPSAALEPEERDFMLASWQDRDACFGMLNWYRASAVEVPAEDAPYALPTDWTPPPMPKLTIPTLVIWALDDLALPPCNLDGLEDLAENLTIERVSGCGHFVQWERPAAVIAAMEDFLGRTENAATA
ncbi:alpha/beta hydrolase [Erythrobacter sp. SG61-1L]|uniref:alpha/beta fold hydrolase n=1 Tax=Erythrobacter sp. SG61-1L TaxID=1603897 RepID=UPI0006C8F2A6|nr:alpha/beta hydrolase [Erythrobacter sp. SG61-1L]KPL67024.1 alpha/beta hydrolase [Erythrobacter sp. SG61-1L]